MAHGFGRRLGDCSVDDADVCELILMSEEAVGDCWTARRPPEIKQAVH